jgi:hypothetical protein
VSRNLILSVQVCRATIQDCKKNISKSKSVFLIFEIFFLKNGVVFRAKVELFLILPKFDWKKIFQKFQPKMVQEGLNHCKMLNEIDFCPSAGRESLWTTGEKDKNFKGPLYNFRSNQIWISLFEALILAHCSNPIYL